MSLTKEQLAKAIEWLSDLPPHILREKIERGHKFGSGETYSDKSKIMEVLQQTACIAEMLFTRPAVDDGDAIGRLREELEEAADTFDKLAASMRETEPGALAQEIAVSEMARDRIRAALSIPNGEKA